MSEEIKPTEDNGNAGSKTASLQAEDASTAQIIYGLYLASIVLGVTSIIGLVMAYINRGAAPEWLKTHYTFAIHTFWKGLLYVVIGMLLTLVLIGFGILLFAFIWYVIRCIKGLQAAGRKEPIENPTGWMF